MYKNVKRFHFGEVCLSPPFLKCGAVFTDVTSYETGYDVLNK